MVVLGRIKLGKRKPINQKRPKRKRDRLLTFKKNIKTKKINMAAIPKINDESLRVGKTERLTGKKIFPQ